MSAKPVSYDPAVIQEFAQRLYRQAAIVVFTSTVLGLLLGALILAIGAGTAGLKRDIGSLALLGAAVGAAFGYVRGRERAFKLKLEAQTALCQVQIETNTRRTN